jgi:predicted Zn-ribbon and HTH transcriptional regulator
MDLDDAREDDRVILPVECNECGDVFDGIEEPDDRCPRCRARAADDVS